MEFEELRHTLAVLPAVPRQHHTHMSWGRAPLVLHTLAPALHAHQLHCAATFLWQPNPVQVTCEGRRHHPATSFWLPPSLQPLPRVTARPKLTVSTRGGGGGPPPNSMDAARAGGGPCTLQGGAAAPPHCCSGLCACIHVLNLVAAAPAQTLRARSKVLGASLRRPRRRCCCCKAARHGPS